MIIREDDIKPTSVGFRVEKKVAGQPRLRKTFATREEARNALIKYLKGEGIAETAQVVTWKRLWENAKKKRWGLPDVKSTTQMDNAERIINWYLGWDKDVRDFDQSTADALYESLLDDGKSFSVINKYHSAVRTMIDEGKRYDLITWKTPILIHHKASAGRINFFDYDQEEQIANILRQTGRSDLASLFLVFIDTGMRTAEGMYLEWRDVDLEARIIRLWGNKTKTGKSRRVVMTQRAYDELKEQHDLQKAKGELDIRVYPEATKSRLRSAWESVRKAMGNLDKDFVWYTTRHTCATRLMKAGVDIKTIQEMLGHARVETTMRYIQFSEGSLVTAAAALDKMRPENRAGTVGTELSDMPAEQVALLKKLLENKELVEKLLAA